MTTPGPGRTSPPASEATAATDRAPADGVWAPVRRRLTAGLVLTVTLVAFESLAVATVMPEVSDDLGGLSRYGWVFSGFFLGTMVGTVLAGRLADTHGTALPYLVGLGLFAGGLVGGGAARSMDMLIAARVLQGLGAGAIPALAYVTVGRAYPPAIRPRVFAVFSTAWVVPGLVGPQAASVLEHALSWRAVFWAILPLVAVAGVMTLPALTTRADRARSPVRSDTSTIPTSTVPVDTTDHTVHTGTVGTGGTTGTDTPDRAGNGDAVTTDRTTDIDTASADGPDQAINAGTTGTGRTDTTDRALGADIPDRATGTADRAGDGDAGGPGTPVGAGADSGRIAWSVVLALGAACVLAGAGASRPVVAGGLLVVGLPVAGAAFLRLMPTGTWRLVPGMPTAVALRGLLTFAFFSVDAFIPLAIIDGRGGSTFVAGTGVTVSALTWATGSWIQQGRFARDGPRRLVGAGLLVLAAGVVGAQLLLHGAPVPVGIALWAAAGLGMGLAYAPLSVSVLALAPPGAEGRATSSLHLCDVLGIALGTGATGTLVALGEGRDWAVTSSLSVAFALAATVAVLGVLSSRRLPRHVTAT